jgi:hypothetical protein
MHPGEYFGLKKSPNWQTAFIRDNLPILGYFAWSGFKHQGWGLLLCQVELPGLETELRLHSWRFSTQFAPGSSLPTYLPAWKIPVLEIPKLVETIAQYHPQREMMLLIQSGGSVEVLWLQNLAITPPECYQQVCDRWDEFMPNNCFGQKIGNINL